MDTLKIIIEEPSGTRRSFIYNVKNEAEAHDIVKMVEGTLKPKFSIASWRYKEDKDKK